MMRFCFLSLCALVLFQSCSPISRGRLNRTFTETETKFQDHTGFIVIDPERGKTIFEYQSDRYFTPASNTKILTLFTAFTVLGDSLPGLRYTITEDSLIFWGTGDPSFLNHLCYSNDRVYQFLKRSPKAIYFSPSNSYMTHFGPGWAWSDYDENYSQERSVFPIYGNSFQLLPLPDQILVVPPFFRQFLSIGDRKKYADVDRDIASNDFVLHPGLDGRFADMLVPFRTSPQLVVDLLKDTLRRDVGLVEKPIDYRAQTLFSVPADSVYKVMMQESDNHMAEQLLLMCAGVLSDSLMPEIAIRYMKKNHFADLKDAPNWRDGSGLSRYNLFTPRFVAGVWGKLYERVPRERLFPLLATGGKSGTIKRLFVGKEPYVFAKTGTLSNNHSLSGFLVTKKGKTLIFSFMNANYVAPVTSIRTNMQRILNLFYEHY